MVIAAKPGHAVYRNCARESELKVAFIKQVLDVHGPWSTVLWKDTTPRQLLDVWPGKATFWEMTCCLQADWYVIPQQLSSDYAREM